MPLSVYYLDDEEGLCEAFSDAFSSSEFAVSTFTEPEKLIEQARNAPPDLFILDYRLPGTNGEKVAGSLDPKIPKCLVTGDIALETTYPFAQILFKPFKKAEILAMMEPFRKKKVG